MTSPLITIIIPVYNASLSLQTTIDSLIQQTLDRWECLCVNDGSKDESSEIIEGVIREDNRIKLIHQPNGGVSTARNRGLSYIKSGTLFFLDADDTLNPSCLEELYHYRKKTAANWCACNVNLYKDGSIYERVRKNDDILLSRQSFISHADYIDTTVVWAKLFNTAWVKSVNLHFNESLCVAEDSLFMSQAVCRADKIAHLGTCYGYNYMTTTLGNNLMQRAASKYPSMQMLILESLLEEDIHMDKITLLCQQSWMRMNLAGTFNLIRKKMFCALVYPSHFTKKSWRIAFSSWKLFIGWSTLFLLKTLLRPQLKNLRHH